MNIFFAYGFGWFVVGLLSGYIINSVVSVVSSVRQRIKAQKRAFAAVDEVKTKWDIDVPL